MNNSKRNRTYNRRSIAEINVVPYIDVMLVLLVIFMVTAPLITQGVQVDLPQASAKELQFDKDKNLPIVVTVNAGGEMFLSIAAKPKEAISANDLLAETQAALTRDPARLVMVKGDKQANYQHVVQAMVLLQHAGAASIGLETNDVKR